MKDFVEELIKRLDKITELIRPVGWSRKIEVVETKAVIEIINEIAEECKPKTNADKIRAMSDEELAEFMLDFANDEINTVSNCGSKEYLIKWLQSETE